MLPLFPKHLQTENRWFISLFSMYCISDSLNNAVRILVEDANAPAYEVVALTVLPPDAVAALFVTSVVLMLPHLLFTVLRGGRRCPRNVVKMAVVGFCLSALLWMLMALFANTELNASLVFWTYAQRALLSLSFGAALGVTLNNSRRRELQEIQRHEATF